MVASYVILDELGPDRQLIRIATGRHAGLELVLLTRDLVGVARLLHLTRDVQKAYPDLCVVGTGYSWLRQYYPYFAAGAIAYSAWSYYVFRGKVRAGEGYH